MLIVCDPDLIDRVRVLVSEQQVRAAVITTAAFRALPHEQAIPDGCTIVLFVAPETLPTLTVLLDDLVDRCTVAAAQWKHRDDAVAVLAWGTNPNMAEG